MADEVRITHLRPDQLEDRRRQAAIAWLPLGTIEWHGRHLPLGVDGLKAERLCESGARLLGGVVFPALYYGDHRGFVVEALLTPDCVFAPDDGVDHRRSVNVALGTTESEMAAQGDRDESGDALARYQLVIEQALWTARSYGFSRVVAIAGHYPIAGPLALAVERFHQQQRRCRVVHGTELELSGGDPREVRHADSFETAQMMALTPELVDMERLDVSAEPVAIGVVGDDPRTASQSQGEQVVAAVVAGIDRRLAALGAVATDPEAAPDWPPTPLRRPS
jgi:creatinine amidohydrolase